jgi:hypothetical protein
MRALPALLISTLALTGCDYVDNPGAPSGDGGGNNGGTLKRRALLEEYTGHRCTTCPAAHVVAAGLANAYGDQMILVGMHVTETFAAPLDPPAADGRYSTDFRTAAGNEYVETFAPSAIPNGLVNRTRFNSSITLSKDAWSSAIAAIVAQDAAMDVWVDTIEHDATNNTVSAVVKVAVLQPLTGEHNVVAYLTEDHIIDWQSNALVSPSDVPDYDHRHVLRRTLGPVWGDIIIPSSAAVGDTLTMTYTDIAMDPAWVAANCEVVAYVYNTTTDEVLQANKRELEP